MADQQRKTNTTISAAFEDLDALMVKAKEMVSLSKSIASKIEQKQGTINEDEVHIHPVRPSTSPFIHQFTHLPNYPSIFG